MPEEHASHNWTTFLGVLTVPAVVGLVVGLAFVIVNWGALQITLFKADWSTAIPAWCQAIGSIAAVIGAVVISRQEYWRQTEAKRTSATYQIAVQLKQWLIKLEDEIRDVEYAEPHPDGEDVPFVFIPDLPFEASLDRVAELGPKHARAVYDLISDKQAAHRDARSILDVADQFQASDQTFKWLDMLYPEAIATCNELEASVGWEKSKKSDWLSRIIGEKVASGKPAATGSFD